MSLQPLDLSIRRKGARNLFLATLRSSGIRLRVSFKRSLIPYELVPRLALCLEMPRAKAPTNFEMPFHVTARCTNKDWFASPMDVVWEIMQSQLFFSVHAFGFKVHAFVLMTNHYHLLLSTPLGNLSGGMRYFGTEVSRALLRDTRRINQVFGARFRPTIIQTFHHFMNAYKYVYRNPVRAGLCELVEDYRYSTLPGLLGRQHLLIPVCEDTILFNGNIEENLRWLNREIKTDDIEAVRKALRRSVFKLPKTDSRPHHLENDLL
jgi:putative transposase